VTCPIKDDRNEIGKSEARQGATRNLIGAAVCGQSFQISGTEPQLLRGEQQHSLP
jgi:hypothetical protein